MELFDVIDSKGNPAGQIVSREKAHAEGIPHRTAHIWIIRKKEGRVQILLQKRSQNKDSFPGKFDTSSAGHIQAGDEPLESALRELKEELGITFIYITHDQEEALTMSDTIVVMNQGYIQQIGTPEDIYNEPENAFVADFIGDSNIFNAIMVRDKLVNIVGAEFPCVDTGFGTNKPVDAVIRPEDIDLVKPEEGTLKGVVTHLIFKGVHYEMEVLANNYEWRVHSTDMFPVGTEVGIHVDPFDIQIMKNPEAEDEEAAGIEE